MPYIAQGGIRISFPSEKAWGGPLPTKLNGTRRGMETVIRRLTFECKNVKKIVGSVHGIVTDRNHPDEIAAVEYVDGKGQTRSIASSLVVGKHCVNR